MLTDQYGNRGIDRHGPGGQGNPDGVLQQDEIDIKHGAPVGAGIQQPMWYSSELQNKCDTPSVDTCAANANCTINDRLHVPGTDLISSLPGVAHQGELNKQKPAREYLQGLGNDKYMGGQKRDKSKYPNESKFWENSNWNDSNDICDWDGISCKTTWDHDKGETRRYITGIDVDDKYFNDPNKGQCTNSAGKGETKFDDGTLLLNQDACKRREIEINKGDDRSKHIQLTWKYDKNTYPLKGSNMCEKNNTGDIVKTQKQWESKQLQHCSNIQIDKACKDNQFCSWKDEGEKCWVVYDDDNKQDVAASSFSRSPTSGTKAECLNNNVSDNNSDYEYKWKVGSVKMGEESKINNYYETLGVNADFNKGSCSLNNKYKRSGLNREDQFKSKSLVDILNGMPNGRVSDVGLYNNVKVYDKITKKSINRHANVVISNDNQVTAVKGLVEETALSQYFLSPENTQVIQDTLRYRVFKKTNIVIDYQSPQELYVVMRSVLLQHANFKTNPNKLVQEIQVLNKHVLNYCINEVSSNVEQYKGYLKDLEKLPYPLDRPLYTERNRKESHSFTDRNRMN